MKTVVERIFVVNYFICLVYFVCSIPIDEFCNCISNKLLKNYSEESYDQIYQMIVCGSAISMLILGKPPGICLISGGGGDEVQGGGELYGQWPNAFGRNFNGAPQ